MKPLNSIFQSFTAIAIALVLALVGFPASAQQAGVYSTLLIGGTNGVVHGVTNTYSTLTTNTYAGNTNIVNFPNNTISVFEHDAIGIELNYSDANPAATNCNIVLLIAQSYDNGTTFETKPSIVLTAALPTAVEQSLNGVNGFTNRCQLFLLTNSVATHLGIVGIGNTGSAAAQDVTNLLVNFVMPNRRVYTEPARR